MSLSRRNIQKYNLKCYKKLGVSTLTCPLSLKIDSSISQCNKMISLLKERKQIIINDVVTGKVKVC